jgi:hypothetical protein
MSALSLPTEYRGHPIVDLLERRGYRFLADEDHANAVGEAINVFVEYQSERTEFLRRMLKQDRCTRAVFRYRLAEGNLAVNHIMEIWKDAFEYGFSDRDGAYQDKPAEAAKRLGSMLSDFEDVNVRRAGDIRPLPRLLRIIIDGVPTMWLHTRGLSDIEMILLVGLDEMTYQDPMVAASVELEDRGIYFDSMNVDHCRLLEEDADKIAGEHANTRKRVQRVWDTVQEML